MTYTTLDYITLHYIILYNISLHYMTFYNLNNITLQTLHYIHKTYYVTYDTQYQLITIRVKIKPIHFPRNFIIL